MVSIHTNSDVLEAMAAKPSDEPVVMLNLLRYRETAEPGFGVDGMSGEAAFREYGKRFAGLHERFGGQPVWMGAADSTVIGDERWDVVILVRYPKRSSFLDMMADPDYQAIAPIRAAALADSRLVETKQLLPAD